MKIGNLMPPLPAIIKCIKGSPDVLDKDARKTWNDNSHGQLQYIFPFKNGIIDLEHPPGYPYPLEVAERELKIIHTDELDMKGTTGYDFKADWPTKEQDIADVDKFLRSCRMTDEEHDYCLMKDAASMLGANVFEEFEIWTGVTSNGKTKSQDVQMNAFGALAGDLDPVFFQKARTNPNEASSFMVKLKFCRVVFCPEPAQEKWDLLAGRIKKITGREYVECRGNPGRALSVQIMKVPLGFVRSTTPEVSMETFTEFSLFVSTPALIASPSVAAG